MQLITELLTPLSQELSNTNLRHFAYIIESILGISTPVTTLSVARMSEISYRTVQRFYALKDINWLVIRLILFKTFIYKENQKYILAADETVEGKAGKSTFGVGYFYSSIAQKVIKSVSFLAISIIDINERKSYLIGCQQIIAAPKTTKEVTVKARNVENTRKKGRPKGSKNKPKTEPVSVSYQTLSLLLTLVMSELKIILNVIKCFHLALDGFYGHEAYLSLALKHKLKIISKFKTNAHLIFPYLGEQSGRGRPKKNGNKINLDQLPSACLVRSDTDENQQIISHIYQLKAYTPKIANTLLNIVILVHIHKVTKKQSRTILFTNDLDMDADLIISYYSLRFQIEFDFRDAKQFYGLSDFKNYHQTQVTNAVNIAFTMTLLGKLILGKYQTKLTCDSMGIIDLKSVFRVTKYAQTFFKSNSNQADAFLNSPQFLNLARLEAIHI